MRLLEKELFEETCNARNEMSNCLRLECCVANAKNTCYGGLTTEIQQLV